MRHDRHIKALWVVVAILAGLVACLLFSGCATNRAVFSETITAPDGTVTTTALELTARATAGSKLQEGSGSVAYTFGDSLLEVGNSAQGLDSESAAKLVQAVLAVVPLLTPILDTWTRNEAATAGSVPGYAGQSQGQTAPAAPEQGEVP